LGGCARQRPQGVAFGSRSGRCRPTDDRLACIEELLGVPIVDEDETLRTRIEALVRAGSVRRKLAVAQLEAEIRRREDVMRETFRRYASPRLADKILEDAQLRDSRLSTAGPRTHAVAPSADLPGLT